MILVSITVFTKMAETSAKQNILHDLAHIESTYSIWHQASTVLLYICAFNRREASVVIYVSVMVFVAGSSDVNISPRCHAAVVTATVCFAKIPSLCTIMLMHISSVLSRSRREAFFF